MIDTMIGCLYERVMHGGPWCDVLSALTRAADLDALHILGVSRRTGRITFHEGSSGLSMSAAMALAERWPSASASQCGDLHLLSEGPRQRVLCATQGTGSPETLQRLLIHLANAVTLRTTQAPREACSLGVAAVLDRLRYPVLLIDARRRLIYANPSGEQLLERRQIVGRHGEAIALRHADDARGLAARLKPGDIALTPLRLRSAPGDPITMLFVLAATADQRTTYVLLFHTCEPAQAVDPQWIAEAFGLTRSEAKVAALLVAGRTPLQVAGEHSVSLTTVRSQLRSIFEKTGTRGQSDLIRLIVGLPALDGTSAPLEKASAWRFSRQR